MDGKQFAKESLHAENKEWSLRAELSEEEWIQKPPHMSTLEWVEQILKDKERTSCTDK